MLKNNYSFVQKILVHEKLLQKYIELREKIFSICNRKMRQMRGRESPCIIDIQAVFAHLLQNQTLTTSLSR